MKMINTVVCLPEENYEQELLGKGNDVSGHKDGVYAVLRYDGNWWNEDGTEIHEEGPESWCYLGNSVKSTNEGIEDGVYTVLRYEGNWWNEGTEDDECLVDEDGCWSYNAGDAETDMENREPLDILGYQRTPPQYVYLSVDEKVLTKDDIIRVIALYTSYTGNKPITMLFPMECGNIAKALVDGGVLPRADGLADGVSDLIIVGPGLRGAPLDFATVRTLLEADYQANKGV